ncbi:hypothetical protein [Flavobacterium humi]|uniref:T9SS C-terminal target domain-containing protein n=1 Tax=Flavobacterium humi TaxID=2562683 RepID=A0A4Z0L5G4_9FLAO|nr:hypothetical protein [Flavobacterium humi]TGD57632.1 hypothetical protein E4635_10615 [Flavobacterium humi]
MKKIIWSIVLCNTLLGIAQTTRGISNDVNWTKGWTNFKPKTTEYRESSNLLVGIISQDMKLYKKEVYLLTGTVYVANGATLTIEPGTVIRGDYSTSGTLVITKGSKIVAIGNETDPIVFTSNKAASERRAGDWGGLVLMGDSPTNDFTGRLDFNLEPKYNVYGGTNEDGDSGALKYVRIEFAGKKTKDNKTLSALSLAGVGGKTILDYIQVSFSNDDSFGGYGGVLNLNNLVSFRAMDDDYDFNKGVQCKIKNSIAVRNPYVSDSGKSRCLEVKSYDIASNADLTKKPTNVTASNMTLLNEENNSAGLIREAVYVKENTVFTFSSSVVSGFTQCILLDTKIRADLEDLKKIKPEKLLLNNCTGYIESENSGNNTQLKNWFNSDVFMNDFSKIENPEFFIETDIKKTPDYRLKANQKLTSSVVTN